MASKGMRSWENGTAPSRRELLQFLGISTAFFAIGTEANTALAEGKNKSASVTWSAVELPDSKLRRQREGVLRSVLRKESRREDWGIHKGGRLEASVTVTEFAVEQKTNVVRVTCTAVGKLEGGPTVRTHFSIGDHPKRQAALEKMVLTLVARGIVTRLASIARKKAARTASTA